MASTTTTRAVVVVDPDGVIRQWDSGAAALFGHPQHHAVGQNLDLIVPAPFQEAHWAAFRRAMRSPKIKDLAADLPVQCADGQVRTFPGRLIVLSDPLGAPVGAMAIFTSTGTTGVHPFS